MTQPTSVNMTFDTSLTPELNQAPFNAEQSQETPKQSQALGVTSPPPKPSTPVQHIPTQDAYDQWASVYDTDGNMLQAIDDLELSSLLPSFLSMVLSSTYYPTLNLLDLGCGTGRNTARLLSFAWPPDRRVNITGLDFSRGMLDVAAKKLTPLVSATPNISLRLEQADCFPTVSSQTSSPIPAVPHLQPSKAVISTLVLEHIPLTPYFSTLSSLLAPGGYALVTNMHSEMGRISQAGFVNADGVKVRGESYAHTPQETAEEARRAGLEVVTLKERVMEKSDVEGGMVSDRGWKWVGIRVWYGMMLKKIG
ncbi:S-adenosyl-L-methionine-dependent methyltransferase [Trematosphaeria pertusa]|uniref:S-adenosyl-L-methionine-dependent methyltransferase n=1 Tax=Trematosphaeria pertusa TaxID=390896 RepID=A0A6A6IPB0_9PLEO|nr:S-adenosyl-L-methionine-dependent methyltransferase [Trematosphaeria pertusa]KAF2252236.1 S-adenosyl-L-methionine-dependent methyltransferase [Trematosphaeria pertusa]